jgi:hypothetical protein
MKSPFNFSEAALEDLMARMMCDIGNVSLYGTNFGVDFAKPGDDVTTFTTATDSYRRYKENIPVKNLWEEEYRGHPWHESNVKASDLIIDMVENEEGEYVPKSISNK